MNVSARRIVAVCMFTCLLCSRASADPIQDKIAECDAAIAECQAGAGLAEGYGEGTFLLWLAIRDYFLSTGDAGAESMMEQAFELRGKFEEALQCYVYAIDRYNAAKQILSSSMPPQQKLIYVAPIMADGAGSEQEADAIYFAALDEYIALDSAWFNYVE
jgi:hypothetical protein